MQEADLPPSERTPPPIVQSGLSARNRLIVTCCRLTQLLLPLGGTEPIGACVQ